MVKEEMTTDLKALGMEFPVVVKTCCGGSSVGVYIVNDQAEYVSRLSKTLILMKMKSWSKNI